MPEANTQPGNIFSALNNQDTVVEKGPSVGGLDLSQSDKDAIMRQIHPIFLTTHTEEKAPVQLGNFDKFLGFLRLCLEGFLKLVDIVVDAAIQISRLFVWVIAIIGVLIVVTLMTNTTDKFIDILNSSIFPIVGLETKIQKVGPTTPVVPASNQKNLESSTVSGDTPQITETSTSIADAAEAARQELIKARRARLTAEQ